MLTVCTGRRCSSHGAAALLTALSLSPPPQMAVRGVGCSGACPPGRVVVCEGPDCPGPCMLLSAGDAGAVKRSAAEARRSVRPRCSSPAMSAAGGGSPLRRVGAAALAAAAGGVVVANGLFGVLDNTGDELADLLGVDEVPPAAVAAVRLLQPLYEPLKAVSPSCTEALYPEFNEVNDWNDCSLLPRRVFWRPGAPPLLIRQTMTKANMWEASTGAALRHPGAGGPLDGIAQRAPLLSV